jgi:hypothetical protein
MDDCLWIYQYSPKRLCMRDYCNEIEGFINYALSNLKNFSGDGSGCSCKRCKNKSFLILML